MTHGLRLVHSNRPEVLRDFLVGWIRRHPRDGLDDETILVQSNGVAQWLKLGLAEDPAPDGSGGLGIASCLDLSLPSRFVWQAYRAVLGADAVPDTSAFDKERLVWRLMRLLSALPEDPVYSPLVGFLGSDRDPMRCYQLAQQIADLFDQYQVYRADWLNAWAEGQDVLIHADRSQSGLAPTDLWQSALWRVLQRDVGPEHQSSRATVHQAFLEKVYGADQRLAGLPSRLFVFGVSALPRQSLEVLQAIAKCSEVFICVHNPCKEDWSGPTHPLLAAWGRQGRDYMGLLQATEEPRIHDRFGQPAQRIDLFESPGRDCLLHQLQTDLLQGGGDSTHRPAPQSNWSDDHSIVFHRSHSPQREVEVLHDQLLAAFDRDSTLQPRDIVVMVPDINAYAPVIEAVFGQHEADDPRRIPFSITDRVLSQQLPMAQALDFLLSLAESRCTASDVIALLEVPAVCQRIALPQEQLPLLVRWIRGANIRWALDSEHRASFTGHAVDQNTWVFGLDRMLLGYAVGNSLSAAAEMPLWQGISPYSEVSGIDAGCVGALAVLVSTMRDYRTRFAGLATPPEWASCLNAMLSDFFAPQSTEEKAFLLQAQSTLLAWQQDCMQAGFAAPIPLTIVRSEWQTRMAQQQFGQRFFAGRVSFATLMPMRAIPFRMVCLLGLNDGEFPRSRPRADFDLMRLDQRPGDRSRRDDDRYLFLEALVSARDRLYLSWVGKSPVDNADRAPSVLVGQLCDYIEPIRPTSALTYAHRLQPFHPDYFVARDLPGADHWFTYAREWRVPQTAQPPSDMADLGSWVDQMLPLPQTSEIAAADPARLRLDDLGAFLKSPVEIFFKERLQVYFGEEGSLGEDDEEAFSVVGLARYLQEEALVDACFQAVEESADGEVFLARALAQMQADGMLPIGAARDAWLAETVPAIRGLFARYQALRAVYEAPPRELSLSGGPGRADRLSQCFCGDGEGKRLIITPRRLHASKGKLSLEKLVGFWVEHLALQVAALDALGCAMTTQVMATDGDVCFAPIDGTSAQRLLNDIGAAYLEGLCRPLPLAPKAGFAWLSASSLTENAEDPKSRAAKDPLQAVREVYEGRAFGDTAGLGEAGYSPYLIRTYPTVEALTADGDFFRLCTRLYAPMKDSLQAVERRSGKAAQAGTA